MQPTTWVTMGNDGHRCPDCANLSGETKEWDEWMAGDILPGNGWTLCKEWCRCLLVPQKWATDFEPDIDLSVKAAPAEEIMAGVVETNAVLKWAVLLETETGYFTDPQQDLLETARIYLAGNETEKALLKEVYPKHHKLIQTLIK
jgi:hypothetical protein